MKWLQRQRHFIEATLSSLLRRKGKNAALLFVFALVVFLTASLTFFAGALRNEARALLSGAPEIVVQRMMLGRHDMIPLSDIEPIAAIRGVRGVKPRLWGYYYHPASQAAYTVMARSDFPHEEDRVIVGPGVTRTWALAEGKRLHFLGIDGKAHAFEVAGEFPAATELLASDLILMAEPAFRRLFGVPVGVATDLAVSVRNLAECETIAEKIAQVLPDTRPIQREEILRTYDSLFAWRSGMALVLFAGAVVALFIFGWDKATGLSAEERREIAILKAVGWETSDVLLMKFWEGATVSLSAFLLGVTAAFAHVFYLPAPLFTQAMKGWAVLYPNFRLTPTVDAFGVAVIFLLTVVPYALVTVVPAWKVAVTDPEAAMRQL